MILKIKRDKLYLEDKSQIVREKAVSDLVRILHFITGNPVIANDHEFHVFDLGQELWVPASIDFEGILNELENWSHKLNIKYETKHQEYPNKAFWKKRLGIKYASVLPGIYSIDQVSNL